MKEEKKLEEGWKEAVDRRKRKNAADSFDPRVLTKNLLCSVLG